MTLWMTGGAVILCCMAAGWDLATRRIPNALTLPALGAALCLHGALPSGQGLLLSLAGALVAAAVVLPGYLMRFTGAGDVKLLMAVGAFLAFPKALFAALGALIVGGVLGLATAIARRRAGLVLGRTAALVHWLAHRATGSPLARPESSKLRVPFGFAIATATVIVVLLPHVGGMR